jgi:hypothetical protein
LQNELTANRWVSCMHLLFCSCNEQAFSVSSNWSKGLPDWRIRSTPWKLMFATNNFVSFASCDDGRDNDSQQRMSCRAVALCGLRIEYSFKRLIVEQRCSWWL